MAGALHALLLEDDDTQSKILVATLKSAGLRATAVKRVDAALELIDKGEHVDLFILDRNLPDGDGLAVCRRLKRDPRTRLLPVIVLTTRSEFDEELKSYKSGADLFLAKPVDIRKFSAFASTLVRRENAKGETPDLLVCGRLKLDPKERTAWVDDVAFKGIPERLFSLLYLLASHQGRPVPAKALLQKLWGSTVRDKEVAVTVSRLRKILGPRNAGLIRFINGAGYSIDPDFTPGA